MTQPQLPFDICARRHQGSAESVAANPAEPHKRQSHERILALLAVSPATSKELAAMMGLPLNCISGRVSELRALGLIEKTGERRDGAAVVRRVR